MSLRRDLRVWCLVAAIGIIVGLPATAGAAPPDVSGVVSRVSGPVIASFADESSGLAVMFGGQWSEVGGRCVLSSADVGTSKLVDAPGSGLHVIGRTDARATLLSFDDWQALIGAVSGHDACPAIEPLGVGSAGIVNVVSTAMRNGAFTVSFTGTGLIATDAGAVQLHARRSIVVTPDGEVVRDVATVRTSS